MERRAGDEQLAATRIVSGADVDDGPLTRHPVGYLSAMKGFAVHYSHRVVDMRHKTGSSRRRVCAKDLKSGSVHSRGLRRNQDDLKEF